MESTADTLQEKLEAVRDRATFLEFVRALVADREAAVIKEAREPSNPYGPDAGGWENTRIETYLESALAWAEASKSGGLKIGGRQADEPPNLWREFAYFLNAGKFYE